MPIADSVYEGKRVRFAAIDHENDPAIESGWTHNPLYLRMLNRDPARPLSAWEIKKKYEALEKEMDDKRNLFYFALRTMPEEGQPDRLIGFARLYSVDWSNGNAFAEIGIGDPQDWGKGYGSEAMQLLLRYAFAELNLYRVSIVTLAYNTRAIRLMECAGFKEEVRCREAVLRDGQRWDMLHFGILNSEWQKSRSENGTDSTRP